jgi:hypothetical protein
MKGGIRAHKWVRRATLVVASVATLHERNRGMTASMTRKERIPASPLSKLVSSIQT